MRREIHFHVVWQLDRKYAPAVMRANGVWEWCHVVAGLKWQLDRKYAPAVMRANGVWEWCHVVAGLKWQLDRKYAPAVMRANGVWEWCHVVAGLKVRKGGKIGILGTCVCHTYLLFSYVNIENLVLEECSMTADMPEPTTDEFKLTQYFKLQGRVHIGFFPPPGIFSFPDEGFLPVVVFS